MIMSTTVVFLSKKNWLLDMCLLHLHDIFIAISNFQVKQKYSPETTIELTGQSAY